MSDKSQFMETVISVANTTELVKRTIAKVGMEFISPLTESVQDEKILKAINKKAVKGASQ